MNADEFVKRVIDRLEHPEMIPPIRWVVVPSTAPPMIDGQPDDMLAATTADGQVICYCWRSYYDAI
jgi:hypothetical protein